ncbi:MAG: antitoxin family protein [bacterium]|nr:antitoxin family protein [bacterium]
MSRAVRAIYENGVLRPLDPLRGIEEHSEVKLIIRVAEQASYLAECIGILLDEDAEEMIRIIEDEFERADVRGSRPVFSQVKTLSIYTSFLRLVANLTDLDQLKPGWNTYDAEPPSATALTTALKVLRSLSSVDYLPDRVLPLADGGVAFVYNNGPLYANFECFNDGEITAGISNRSDHHEAWDVDLDSVEDSAGRIRAFLNA